MTTTKTTTIEPQQGDDDEATGSLDLARHLRALRKHKWVIIVTVAVITTATTLYTMRLPKMYEATASLVIDPRPDAILGDEVKEVVQLGSGTYWANQEYYNTQVEIITSRAMSRLTTLGHDLHKNPKIVGKLAEQPEKEGEAIDRATRVVRGAMQIQRPKDNRILRITFRHGDPEVAAFLANAVVDTYIEFSLNRRLEGTGDAAKWLSDELDTAERALAKSESDLSEYKRDNDILSVSLEDRQNIVAANITRYSDAANEARTNRIKLGVLRDLVKKAAKDDVLQTSIFALADNTAGPAFRAKYYEERIKLIELEGQLGPRNPEYLAQQKKVDDLHAAIEREAVMVLDAIEKKHASAIATEAAFAAEVERYKQEAFALGPKRVAYNQLIRRERSDEERYTIVLGRLRASDLTSRLKSINIRPLDQAAVPSSAAYPILSKNIVVAAVLALFLGVGLALFIEFMDRTVKTTEDVERAVGAPLLGIIPVVGDDENRERDRERDLLVHLDPTSRAAECCRSIRTNLMFSSADKQLRTITVASANPREGKTTSVLYLGTTMAQSGQRVLVVDSDMRRPRLHQSMGVSRTQGLSNLILGDVDVDDVVKTTDIPNLFILPCGPTPPNPAELLTTERFKETLDLLESKFDRILLDSPPLLAVTDAVVLSRRSDGVILVMRAGRTLRDDASRAARALKDVDANIIGVVLNELDLEDRSYGYYYNYAYGYGNENPAEANANSPT